MNKYIKEPWNKKYKHEKCICGHVRMNHSENEEECLVGTCKCNKFVLSTLSAPEEKS